MDSALLDRITKAFSARAEGCKQTAGLHAAEYVRTNKPEDRAASQAALASADIWKAASVIARDAYRSVSEADAHSHREA